MKTRIALALGAFVVITIGTVFFSRIQADWTKWRQANCMPDDCFCERVHNGTIRQPANTYSNLGFVLVGCLFIAFGPFAPNKNGKNSEKESESSEQISIYSPPYYWLYGLSVIAVGLFSFLYHASLTFVGQWLDVMAMYLIITFAILYAINRAFPLSPQKFVAIYISINILLGLFLYYLSTFRRPAFVALVIIALAAEMISRKKLKNGPKLTWLWWAVGSLAAGFGVWLLDYYRIVCDPESIIQGHAIWHFLSALAAAFLFLYFRTSEKTA